MAKRVWILGAGFSRALGGPLLADMLSMRSWQRLKARWSGMFEVERLFQTGHQSLVYALYHYGRNCPEGYLLDSDLGMSGEDLFSDAEDFLVQLSSPEQRFWEDLSKRAFRTFERHGYKLIWPDELSLPRLERAARRLMAAECEMFIDERAAEKGAIWEPFRRWGKS